MYNCSFTLPFYSEHRILVKYLYCMLKIAKYDSPGPILLRKPFAKTLTSLARALLC